VFRFPTGLYLNADFDTLSSCILSTIAVSSSRKSEFLLQRSALSIFPFYPHFFDSLISYILVLALGTASLLLPVVFISFIQHKCLTSILQSCFRSYVVYS
jgi:hypothetical protein